MRTDKDVESYLLQQNRPFRALEQAPGTFIIETSRTPQIAIRVDPPLVVMRVHVGDLDRDDQASAKLFRKLLELNAQALVHANFGLEEKRIVLSAALELENLDYNELAAVLDEIDMALAQHIPMLAELNRT